LDKGITDNLSGSLGNIANQGTRMASTQAITKGASAINPALGAVAHVAEPLIDKYISKLAGDIVGQVVENGVQKGSSMGQGMTEKIGGTLNNSINNGPKFTLENTDNTEEEEKNQQFRPSPFNMKLTK
jgi:hypothetical protein